jgi:hypothetical protein
MAKPPHSCYASHEVVRSSDRFLLFRQQNRTTISATSVVLGRGHNILDSRIRKTIRNRETSLRESLFRTSTEAHAVPPDRLPHASCTPCTQRAIHAGCLTRFSLQCQGSLQPRGSHSEYASARRDIIAATKTPYNIIRQRQRVAFGAGIASADIASQSGYAADLLASWTR